MAGATRQQPPTKRDRITDGEKKFEISRFFDHFRHIRYNYIVKVEKRSAFAIAVLPDADQSNRQNNSSFTSPEIGLSPGILGIIALGGEAA